MVPALQLRTHEPLESLKCSSYFGGTMESLLIAAIFHCLFLGTEKPGSKLVSLNARVASYNDFSLSKFCSYDNDWLFATSLASLHPFV